MKEAMIDIYNKYRLSKLTNLYLYNNYFIVFFHKKVILHLV